MDEAPTTSPEKRVSQKKEGEWQRSHSRAQVICNYLLVGCGAVGVVLVILQLRETRQSNELTRQAIENSQEWRREDAEVKQLADQAADAERTVTRKHNEAVLKLSEDQLAEARRNFELGQQSSLVLFSAETDGLDARPIVMRVVYENYGSLAAEDIAGVATLGIGRGHERIELRPPRVEAARPLEAAGTGATEFKFDFGDESADRASVAIAAVKTGQRTMTLYGKILYRDALLELRESSFCFDWHPSGQFHRCIEADYKKPADPREATRGPASRVKVAQ